MNWYPQSLQQLTSPRHGRTALFHKTLSDANEKLSNSMSWAIIAVWSSSSPPFKYSIYRKFPKNILPDFHCFDFETQAHYKKYVIHMSMSHFYPVHKNAVFILNVKMPFMSLFMSPLKSLFLNDGRTCFAKFKIYKGIVILFQTSASVYSWENPNAQIENFGSLF